MRLFSGLFTGKESLISHGSALGVIADNLANSNSTAFKPSRINFEDLLAQGVGGLYNDTSVSAGNGVTGDSITTAHHQAGLLEVTGRPLDVAIDGQGFFVVNDGTDDFYTRAGNFVADPDGNIQTAEGLSVMGFTEESPDTLVPLNVSSSGGQAAATTTATFVGNLDASSEISAAPDAPELFSDISDTSAFSVPVPVIDSLGETQEVILHFFHEANLDWTVQAYADDADLGAEAQAPVLLDELAFSFDGTGAMVTDPATLTVSPQWGNGATPADITLDVSGFTGFASESALNSVTTDGTVPGTSNGVVIRENGDVVVLLSGGVEDVVGQLGIGTFVALDGLQRLGENRFRATELSGEAEVGLADTGSRGVIKGGQLENSIVDPANEFINLIRFQRGYQAGSQVVSTINELLTSTIQIA